MDYATLFLKNTDHHDKIFFKYALTILMGFVSLTVSAESSFEGFQVGFFGGGTSTKVKEGQTYWEEYWGLNGPFNAIYYTKGANGKDFSFAKGVNLGYNKVFGNKILVGVEIDYTKLTNNVTSEAVNYDISTPDQSDRILAQTRIKNIQTLRLKFGYSNESKAIYLTGGLATRHIVDR